MGNKLLSVIVPCYNVEKYINNCIGSIENQFYKNIEIIIINDGSTDNTLSLIRQLASQYKNIVVLNQNNQGLASTRNNGLKTSNGDYVSFVDGDDYVSKYIYIDSINIAEKCNADVVCFNFEKTNVFDSEIKQRKDTYEVLSTSEAIKELSHNGKINNSVNNKIFRRSLFNNISFSKGIVFEDADITYKIIFSSNLIAYVNNSYYCYYQSPKSILRGKFNPKLFEIQMIYSKKLEFYEHNYPEYVALCVTNMISEFITIVYLSRKTKSVKQARNKLINYIYALKKAYTLEYYNSKCKIKIKIFFISKHLLYFLLDLTKITGKHNE